MWWSPGIGLSRYPVVVVLDVMLPLISLLVGQPLLIGGLIFFVGYFFYGDGEPPFYRLGANDFLSCSFLVVWCQSYVFIGVGWGSDDRMLASIQYSMAIALNRGCTHAHHVLVA